MKSEKNEKLVIEELKKIIDKMEKEEVEKHRKAKNEFKKKLAESKPIITKESFERAKKNVYQRNIKLNRKIINKKESR